MKKIMIMSLPLLAILIAASLTTMLLSPAAYGQQQPDRILSFGDASPEAERMMIELAVSALWNLTSQGATIGIDEEGSLSITQFEGDKYLSVTVPTNITRANGYEINNGVLTAPNGTELFP